MNQSSIEQLAVLAKIADALRIDGDSSDKVNSAIFGVANKIGVHPHDLAIYILIRTTSL